MARAPRARARMTRRSTLRDLSLGFLTVAILAALVGLATQGALQAPVRTGEQWKLKGEAPRGQSADFDLGTIPMNGDYVVGRAPLRHVRTLKAPSARARARTWYDIVTARNFLTYPLRALLSAVTTAVTAPALALAFAVLVMAMMAGRGPRRAAGGAAPAGGRAAGGAHQPPGASQGAGPGQPQPGTAQWEGVVWPDDSPIESAPHTVHHVDAEGVPHAGPAPQGAPGGARAAHFRGGEAPEPQGREGGQGGPDRAQENPPGRAQGGHGPTNSRHGSASAAQAGAAGGAHEGAGAPNQEAEETPTKISQRRASRAEEVARAAVEEEADARRTASTNVKAALGNGIVRPPNLVGDEEAHGVAREVAQAVASPAGAATPDVLERARIVLQRKLDEARTAGRTSRELGDPDEGDSIFLTIFPPAMNRALVKLDEWEVAAADLKRRRVEERTANSEHDTLHLERTQARTRAREAGRMVQQQQQQQQQQAQQQQQPQQQQAPQQRPAQQQQPQQQEPQQQQRQQRPQRQQTPPRQRTPPR